MLSSWRSTLCVATRRDAFIEVLRLDKDILTVDSTVSFSISLNDSELVLPPYISKSGRHLIIATNKKKLSLYTKDKDLFKYVGSIYLPKSLSCITVTSDELSVVAGDKSGNVHKIELAAFTASEFGSRTVLLLGHLSILSDISISDDDLLLASGDRDGKIRISRFAQPSVIESFCLGHEAFVSQVKFIPKSHHVVSSGGDGTLRLWLSQTGKELSCLRLTIPDLTDAHQTGGEKRPPAVISRLCISDSNVCVGCFSSQPIVFAVTVTTEQTDAGYWGALCQKVTPDAQPLVDCALCSATNYSSFRLTLIGLSPGTPHKFISWSVTKHSGDSLVEEVSLTEIRMGNISPDILLDVPAPTPLQQLLSLLHRPEANRSMIEMYEANKSSRQQNVLSRKLRHQHKRNTSKRMRHYAAEGEQNSDPVCN